MQFIYSLGIWSYYLIIKSASFFGNKKAKAWLLGRVNWQEKLQENIPINSNLYWFHVASLGEFEQAVPIIEQVKHANPNQFVLLTFFSPSGYQVKKNYPLADYVCYLPIDSKKNAKVFISLIQAQKVFFIKYEFWFNLLSELRNNKIDTYLVSGIFRPTQHFFKSYGSWFKEKLNAFSHFFVQNQTSQDLLKSIGFDNSSVTGDTRLDQVLAITQEKFENTTLKTFSKNSEVIIFGSSWEKEHEFAIQLFNLNPNYKFIIAPHEINKGTIDFLRTSFSSQVKLWSEIHENESLTECRVIIVDSIGLLSKIYRFGKYAVIGGGFGNGIHNILEPLAYNVPVFFGPKFQKFQEANDSIQQGIGFSVGNIDELNNILTHLSGDKKAYFSIQEKIRNYLSANLGATKRIMEFIKTTN